MSPTASTPNASPAEPVAPANEVARFQPFRRRPFQIEALQLTKEIRDAVVLDGLAIPGLLVGSASYHRENRTVFQAALRVRNQPGPKVEIGDWLCRLNGELFSVAAGEFAGTYEPEPTLAPSNDLIDLLRTFASGRGPHGGRLTMEDVRALSQAALVKAGAA